MTHYVTDEHLGSFRRAKVERPSYRFGRRRVSRLRGLSALHYANSYLKALIQSIADAKFRRMLRELQVRGARPDMQDELWIPDQLRDRAARKA